jgi:hypothetical protein
MISTKKVFVSELGKIQNRAQFGQFKACELETNAFNAVFTNAIFTNAIFHSFTVSVDLLTKIGIRSKMCSLIFWANPNRLLSNNWSNTVIC